MKSISKVLFKKMFMPCLLLSGIFSSLNAMAQGNLLVTPKRVVFEGANRSEELNLANVGKDSATYVVSFIQIRMKADGTFEKITEPDSAQLVADKNLRFFPRTVTLGPNEAQTVKLQLTKAQGLSAGEYRSHLYFRAIPNEKPLGEVGSGSDTSISVKLVPIFGISIPAIIRIGESTAKMQLSDVALKMDVDSTPIVKLTFNRSGNMSLYGDISVDHVSPQGKTTRVGLAKGIAVYTPNIIRNFKLPLTKNAGINFHAGKLHVTYTDQTSKAKILAEEEIALN